LVNQVLLRESGGAPSLTLQTRALAQRPDLKLPETEVLLGFSNGVDNIKQASSLGRGLLLQLQQQGLRYQFSNGALESSEYGAAAAQQALFQNTGQNKELALVWASPLAKVQLRQQSEPNAQNLQFKALGIASSELDVAQLLATSTHAQAAVPAQLEQRLNRYLQQQDVVLLHAIVREHPDVRWQYVIDKDSHHSYLLLWQGQTWLAALNLSSKDPQRIQHFERAQNAALQTNRFISNNMTWLKS
jgi:hypothetical protein